MWWIIWKGRNSQSFEGKERPTVFLNLLLFWLQEVFAGSILDYLGFLGYFAFTSIVLAVFLEALFVGLGY